MTAVEIIDAEVRDVVRRHGLDPVADPARVRRIISDVVAEYDERSLTRSLPPLGNPDEAAKTVLDAVAGFGPLQPYFDDPAVEEIWVNDQRGRVHGLGWSAGRRAAYLTLNRPDVKC